MAQNATQQVLPIHPVMARYFLPIYSSLICYPVQIWNSMIMNLWYIHIPFAYSSCGTPPFYTFWSIDQMIMAEKDAIWNSLYALELYWMITLLDWKASTCIMLSSYFGNKITYEIYCFPRSASSTYAFGLSTSTKMRGAYAPKWPPDGPTL
jgi:hypothetical protein